MPSRGLQGSGDLDTSESVMPLVYCLTRFMTRDDGFYRLVNWTGNVWFSLRGDDPANPRDGEVWLKV